MDKPEQQGQEQPGTEESTCQTAGGGGLFLGDIPIIQS